MNDIKEQHVCISKSNIKLGMIPSVSLPPIVTCSPLACKFCGKKCYARKMCKLRRSVKESYENNLDILLNDKEKFWREVSGSMALTTYFRFFVSGDIYDKDFLENMVLCAKKNKHCIILCFTKKYSSSQKSSIFLSVSSSIAITSLVLSIPIINPISFLISIFLLLNAQQKLHPLLFLSSNNFDFQKYIHCNYQNNKCISYLLLQ